MDDNGWDENPARMQHPRFLHRPFQTMSNHREDLPLVRNAVDFDHYTISRTQNRVLDGDETCPLASNRIHVTHLNARKNLKHILLCCKLFNFWIDSRTNKIIRDYIDVRDVFKWKRTFQCHIESRSMQICLVIYWHLIMVMFLFALCNRLLILIESIRIDNADYNGL